MFLLISGAWLVQVLTEKLLKEIVMFFGRREFCPLVDLNSAVDKRFLQ